MLIRGIDNQIVELRIHNYQFRGNTYGYQDNNWLDIYLNVKSKAGHWQTTDPSLTTREVQELIDWFVLLSANSRPENPSLVFTEPNLSFDLPNENHADQKLIRINFNAESRPQSATGDSAYFVDFIADKEELLRLSTDLKNELSKFPERNPDLTAAHSAGR